MFTVALFKGHRRKQRNKRLSKWKQDWPAKPAFLRWERHVFTKHKLSAEFSPSEAAANTFPPVSVSPHLPSTFHLFLFQMKILSCSHLFDVKRDFVSQQSFKRGSHFHLTPPLLGWSRRLLL